MGDIAIVDLAWRACDNPVSFASASTSPMLGGSELGMSHKPYDRRLVQVVSHPWRGILAAALTDLLQVDRHAGVSGEGLDIGLAVSPVLELEAGGVEQVARQRPRRRDPT